jgi:hypothetical protein
MCHILANGLIPVCWALAVAAAPPLTTPPLAHFIASYSPALTALSLLTGASFLSAYIFINVALRLLALTHRAAHALPRPTSHRRAPPSKAAAEARRKLLWRGGRRRDFRRRGGRRIAARIRRCFSPRSSPTRRPQHRRRREKDMTASNSTSHATQPRRSHRKHANGHGARRRAAISARKRAALETELVPALFLTFLMAPYTIAAAANIMMTHTILAIILLTPVITSPEPRGGGGSIPQAQPDDPGQFVDSHIIFSFKEANGESKQYHGIVTRVAHTGTPGADPNHIWHVDFPEDKTHYLFTWTPCLAPALIPPEKPDEAYVAKSTLTSYEFSLKSGLENYKAFRDSLGENAPFDPDVIIIECNDSDKALRDQLTTLRLKKSNCLGDGDCFFHSVGKLLGYANTSSSGQPYTTARVDELRAAAHASASDPAFTTLRNIYTDAEIAGILKRKKWSGPLAFRALAAALKRDIVLISGTPSKYGEPPKTNVFYQDPAWRSTTWSGPYDIIADTHKVKDWLGGGEPMSAGSPRIGNSPPLLLIWNGIDHFDALLPVDATEPDVAGEWIVVERRKKPRTKRDLNQPNEHGQTSAGPGRMQTRSQSATTPPDITAQRDASQLLREVDSERSRAAALAHITQTRHATEEARKAYLVASAAQKAAQSALPASRRSTRTATTTAAAGFTAARPDDNPPPDPDPVEASCHCTIPGCHRAFPTIGGLNQHITKAHTAKKPPAEAAPKGPAAARKATQAAARKAAQAAAAPFPSTRTPSQGDWA